MAGVGRYETDQWTHKLSLPSDPDPYQVISNMIHSHRKTQFSYNYHSASIRLLRGFPANCGVAEGVCHTVTLSHCSVGPEANLLFADILFIF